MHSDIEIAYNALTGLATTVLNAFPGDATLRDHLGWNHPLITKRELADIPYAIAISLTAQEKAIVDSGKSAKFPEIARRVEILATETVPQLFNGNGPTAIPVFLTTLEWIKSQIPVTQVDWSSPPNKNAMPHNLVRRLNAYQTQLDTLTPDMAKLEGQVKQIQEASEAADSFPADIAYLKREQKKIDEITDNVIKLQAKIQEYYDTSGLLAAQIMGQERETAKLVAQVGEAYSITTTKGLAAAFDERATNLTNSVTMWVVGLMATLGLAGAIGYLRFTKLTEEISAPSAQWATISMHIVLSIFSLGAPFWFAWIATKQIGQRFRLAEDYGFKASVAKAYEGYKREAAKLDETFSARLFSSALSRLEEAPLRLIDNSTPGSPWHELISSQAFRDAMNQVPALRDKFFELAKDGLSKLTLKDVKEAIESMKTLGISKSDTPTTSAAGVAATQLPAVPAVPPAPPLTVPPPQMPVTT
ncbi:hypothetical protein [Undibacterium terreum]|uniref:Uncharacterized protein n=1 Tax=Undibacterium terreum TaxID=1224302 RepID=A0A916V0Q8_9BURK|nr:hypothetical protein [Undibacterium terreum]GGD00181.1 hypothetical protein GCM10011396_54620 [Undibacterium terreum]